MNTDLLKHSRIDMAKIAAMQLLDELETGTAPIEQSLMRAKRIARLLRDEDAQEWLKLEVKGYPIDFNLKGLNSCHRYLVEGGRETHDGRYYTQSLPVLEAQVASLKYNLTSMTPPKGISKVNDFISANATLHILEEERKKAIKLRQAYLDHNALFISMKSAIHAYATDVSLALEFGDAAQDIFESARRDVDVFLRVYCPSALQQLLSINERMKEEQPESYSLALTSCRRLLVTVADAVFPAQSVDYVDGDGVSRKVGQEEYKNRLLAYINSQCKSNGTLSILSNNIQHLAARLEAINHKAAKGVHADVTESEAKLTVIETYIFLAELARFASKNK